MLFYVGLLHRFDKPAQYAMKERMPALGSVAFRFYHILHWLLGRLRYGSHVVALNGLIQRTRCGPETLQLYWYHAAPEPGWGQLSNTAASMEQILITLFCHLVTQCSFTAFTLSSPTRFVYHLQNCKNIATSLLQYRLLTCILTSRLV